MDKELSKENTEKKSEQEQGGACAGIGRQAGVVSDISSVESASSFIEKALLNYKQAARYLSVSEAYLRRLKARGKIPYVPMGDRGVRFRVRSLQAWVERREIS